MTSQLDSLLRSATSGDNPRLPGAFVSVVTTDAPDAPPRQTYLSACGRRDLSIPAGADPRGDVDPQTLIYIASCTKSLVAVAVLQLLSEGVIPGGLDSSEAVERYIPEITRNGVFNIDTGEITPVSRPVTLRQLLSHTSGSAYPFKYPALQKWTLANNVPSAFSLTTDAFLTLPLIAQPGEQWAYGYGLDWAALLIQRLYEHEGGRTVEDVLSERILRPLGMTRTSFSSQRLVRDVDGDDEAKNIYESRNGMQIHFRRPDDGGLELCTDPLTQFPRPSGGVFEEGPVKFHSGGAGLISTIEDYSRWLAYLVTLTQASRHPHVLDRLPPSLRLDPTYTRQFITPHLDANQRRGLEETLREEGVAEPLDGEYAHISHTPVLALYEVPSQHGNPAGTLFWSGITNLFYAIDPGHDDRNPSAVMVATQILPYRDAEFKKLLYAVTRVVYGGGDASGASGGGGGKGGDGK